MLNLQKLKENFLLPQFLFDVCEKAVGALQIDDEATVREITDELLSLVHEIGEDQISEIAPHMRIIFGEMEAYLEKCASIRFSRGLRSSMAEAMGSLDDYHELIKQEWCLMQKALSSEDVPVLYPRLVFVGSGALPISGLLLAQKYNLKVTCIDNDAEAVALSKKIFAGCQDMNSLNIIEADGRDFEYTDIDVVFLASLAQPKLEILKQIQKFPIKGIVTRHPVGPYHLFYEPVDPSMLCSAGFMVTNCSVPAEKIMHKSLFLRAV